ncbi:MAG: amidohydrolase [Gemmatimonadetes bacterium]|nr:amidohydrolase [Gemmatimonadota bacterium]
MKARSILLALCALSACQPSRQAPPVAHPNPMGMPEGPRSPGWPQGRDGPADEASAADMVFVGGRVFLADSANTVAQAIAIRDGRVLAVGTDAEVRRFAGRGTEVIDLRGRLVTPGFNDAHIHFSSGGQGLLNVSLLGTNSLAEIERRVAEAAAQAQPGEWILGRGWDHTRLPASELGPGGWPTKEVLDRAAPNNPVFLSRVDGHTSWANAAAMRLAGIDRTTPNPPGGEVVRDARGEATGIFKESAEGLIGRHVPAPTRTRTRRGITAALEMAARTGVTSVQTDVSGTDMQIYKELLDADSLTVRVYGWHPLEMRTIQALDALGVTAGFGDEWLRMGMLKGYTDGTLGSRTAALLEPFADDHSTHGLPQYTRAQLDSLVTAADAAGLQVLLHAIGDAANRQALDAFERAARANGPRPRRHRIEHAQVVDRDDIPRFRELGVIASMQPTHATSDMRWAEARIGPERAREGAYAWRSLLDAGAVVIFGTDFPVEPMPPVEGIYSAVTRQSREEPGVPPGGWLPEQRLTREEAIRLYTAASAYGEWEEERKGTLRPGMLADLVVWDRDLLTIPELEILQAAPALTVVGGRIVFRR